MKIISASELKVGDVLIHGNSERKRVQIERISNDRYDGSLRLHGKEGSWYTDVQISQKVCIVEQLNPTLKRLFNCSQKKCPLCGNEHLKVSMQMVLNVKFGDDGHYEVTDEPLDELNFDHQSEVLCSRNLGGCGWSGTLLQAVIVNDD